MTALVGVSLIAAFAAGIAALFAPCCIGVLLPSYLGNIFREKYKVFLMTFVFFLGIATVFLPIGLGASFLAQFFARYHNVIFAVGGLFLVALGAMLLFGWKFLATPTSVREGMKGHVTSIYLLGIFSAIATTCCAPVLAGVLALSVTSGSAVWGTFYTLAYVLGMTLPLFLIAALLDKVNLTEKFAHAKKTVRLHIGSYAWRISISELVSGLIFLAMGGYIVYLAFTDRLFMQTSYQLQVNIWDAKLVSALGGLTAGIPDYAWAALLVAVLASLTYVFVRQLQKKPVTNDQQ